MPPIVLHVFGGLCSEVKLQGLVPVDVLWSPADEGRVDGVVVRLNGPLEHGGPVSCAFRQLDAGQLLPDALDGGVEGGPGVPAARIRHVVMDLLFYEVLLKGPFEFVSVVRS